MMIFAGVVVTALLPPNYASHGLLSTSSWSTPNVNCPRCRSLISPSGRRGARSFYGMLVPWERHAPVGAVTENTATAEKSSNAEGFDIPKSAHVPPRVTVIAGPGARISPFTSGVVVEQDDWNNDNFDEVDNVDAIPARDNKKTDVTVDEEGMAIMNYDPDLGSTFHGAGIYMNNNNDILAEINKEAENKKDIEFNLDKLDENESTDDSVNNFERETNTEPDGFAIGSTMEKSTLLKCSGVGGTIRKSSRINGQSSNAKIHVIEGSALTFGVGCIDRVFGTMGVLATAAAQEKSPQQSMGKSGGNQSTKNSVKTNSSSFDWNTDIQSTVANMLQNQDVAILQQYVGGSNLPLPPGTTSMGLLGEAVQENLHTLPPLPGTHICCTDEDLPIVKPQISIRSSIPRSSDDEHIANLRLSVFSRFDEKQQRIFRSRSIEVLNVRRRRGAVVLVAELQNEVTTREHRCPHEMQARIFNGHTYGLVHCCSPLLTVKLLRGEKIIPVSSGFAFERNLALTTTCSSAIRNVKSISESDRALIIGSVECSHQEFCGTMLGDSRPKGSLMYVTEVAVRTDARRCGAGAMLMRGVDEVAALRNVESIYLHVDVTNQAACAMYEKCGYRYLDKQQPIYAQFTASLNLHDGAMHGRKHHLMFKNIQGKTTWLGRR